MDPGFFPRYIAMVFRFWIRIMGKRLFWGLFALSTAVVCVLIAKGV